jgi:hypothetical protein
MKPPDPFDPIHGVELSTYVSIRLALVRRGGDAPRRLGEILADHGVDARRWNACQTGWVARLRDRPEARDVFRRLYAAGPAPAPDRVAPAHGGPGGSVQHPGTEGTAPADRHTEGRP